MMRVLLTILAIITALVGLALSILPMGVVAIVPIIIAFVLAFLAFRYARLEEKGVNTVKFIFLLIIISLCLTIYRSIFEENVVENDIETIQNEQESLEDAKEELEDLDID